MRAIWTGTIGFGLVNIPIKIYTAIQSSTLDLDMLDKKNHANIKFQRVNESTGRVVEWENIVKGYKYGDEYVVLEDADFEKASPEKSKTIDINEFVKEEEIDANFFDTPYYCEPAKGGERAYALLAAALKETGKVALGTFVMRTKENFCMLKAEGDLIEVIKLRFPEEIRATTELTLPKQTEVKPAELKMAVSLITQLTPKKFNIDKYKDTYSAALMKIIEAKAKGKTVSQPKFKMVQSKSKDLMDQLKESLETRKKVRV
ncbi:non-homologous end joining protein Ku [Taibaiella soli]|uniref:Non-homologous end joining protein Ku n=1 Tax=Taibaiella soli TaxID=1649169 RepID=A0A2W2B3G5_9BACT|nr:Ku protein [Taibaiella soli]PZF74548.1 Ku protein [Taibaiella soli]